MAASLDKGDGDGADHGVPGLADLLDPSRVCARSIAARERPDGRALDAFRPVALEYHDMASEGSQTLTIASATASVGLSRCRSAVLLSVAQPDEALVSFEVRRGCLAPDDRWARRVERLLDDSYASDAALDRARLEIAEGAFWKLTVKVICLSDDGAAGDCCVLAASAALARAELPAVAVEDGDVVLAEAGAEAAAAPIPARPLPLALLAAPLTCAVFDGVVLADPASNEAAASTTVTVVVAVDPAHRAAPPGKLLKIAVPGGNFPVPRAGLEACVALAAERAAAVDF